MSIVFVFIIIEDDPHFLSILELYPMAASSPLNRVFEYILPLILLVRVPSTVEAATSTTGCGSPLPIEVITDGRSHSFTELLSNSTSPPSNCAYSLSFPQDYNIDVPAPLILPFHGREENNLDQEKTSEFSNPYFNTKAIAVYTPDINVCL